MSQVSKNKLSNQIYERIFSLFPQFLYRMTSKGRQIELVDTFFTHTEQVVFAKRIAIALMIVKGYTYREISSKIKVSTGTIRNIADLLRIHDAVIKKELHNIAKEDIFKEFLGEINYQISKILPPKGGNWSTWRLKIEKSKKESEIKL